VAILRGTQERGMNKTLAEVPTGMVAAKAGYSWDEVRAELGLDEDAVALQRARLAAEVQAHKLAEVRRRH
jgi:hypothetical protein